MSDSRPDEIWDACGNLQDGERFSARAPWEPFAANEEFLFWRREVHASKAKKSNGDQAFGWASGWAKTLNKTPEEVCNYVADLIELVTGERPSPKQTKTSGGQLMGLWADIGRPELEKFKNQIRGVARWARESPDPLAKRDIQAEGWNGGVNRSRSVATLTTRKKWDERLAAARDWAGHGRKTATEASMEPRRADERSVPIDEEIAAWKASQSEERDG